jgi:hypothetical protein
MACKLAILATLMIRPLRRVSILGSKRCEVCDETFIAEGRSALCCTRKSCRALAAEFTCFYVFESILGASRWAGAPSQEQMQKDYFRDRMWDGMRRLPHSEDVLGEVLIEIVEDTSK